MAAFGSWGDGFSVRLSGRLHTVDAMLSPICVCGSHQMELELGHRNCGSHQMEVEHRNRDDAFIPHTSIVVPLIYLHVSMHVAIVCKFILW